MKTETSWSIRNQQVPALDGLRGIAIFLVLIHHFGQFYPKPTTTIETFFYGVLEAGWTGVDLFFVLSGFLITSILLESREKSDYYFVFFSRRILRIFPLYYAALAFYFFILPKLPIKIPLPSSEAHWWYWLYATNIDNALHGWPPRAMNHFWSLAVEEHFYLFWPFVVRLVSPKRLLSVCAALIVGAAILRGVIFWETGEPRINYVFTLTRLDTLCVGAVLATLAHLNNGFSRISSHLYKLGAIGWISVISLGFMHHTLRWDIPSVAGQMLSGIAIALFFATFIVAIFDSRISFLTKPLNSILLRTLGKYSYGIYVWHFIVDETLRRGSTSWGLRPQVPHSVAEYIVAIVERTSLTLILSYFSFHFFEKWFLKLKPK